MKILAKTLVRPVTFLLLPVLLLTLMGASCAHINPTDHSPDAKPLFDVYFFGSQSTKWVENDNTDCWINKGAGTEQLTFGMLKPLRLEASTGPTYKTPTEFQIKDIITTDGTLGYSYDPKCGTPAAGGGGSGDGEHLDTHCGTEIGLQRGFLQDEGEGKLTLSLAAGLGANLDDVISGSQYRNCPNALLSPYFVYLDADRTLKIVLPKGDLTDGTKLALTKSGSDTYTRSSSIQGSVAVDWTLTLCRVNSILHFTEAVNAAKRELEKSSTYRQFDSQHANLPILEKTLPKGTFGAHRVVDEPTKTQVIFIDWDQLSNGFDLMGTLAHEMGHANDFTTKGYTPALAAPFLPHSFTGVDEYNALVWQEELDADQYALKMLREVEQADHSLAPCVEGFIRSGEVPYLTELAQGGTQAAKDSIKAIYGDQEQRFRSNRDGTQYPDVQTKLQSVDLTQLVNAWK